jgi:short-subunit dehydrogenase
MARGGALTLLGSVAGRAATTAGGLASAALGDARHQVLTAYSRTPATLRAARRVTGGSLHGAVAGKVVVVTGASSGIGEATAELLAEAGATVALVARRRAELEAVAERIVAAGGRAGVHPCDLTDYEAIDGLVAAIESQHGHVDVLVNNAGRSIRRPIDRSYERMHDFERTMQINYYAAVKLTLALLPGMRRRGDGQIVNVLSEGLLLHTPRFAAYLASKAALDEFSRCLANEVRRDGVRVTGVHMPLVRTPMIAPTRAYRGVPALRPREAAGLIGEAIAARPYAVTSRSGYGLLAAGTLVPSLLEAGIARVAGAKPTPRGGTPVSPSASPAGDAAPAG